MSEGKEITVALAGQPNVGKSSVFNILTGLSQHVGNWPGKTVEQKTGTYQHDGDIVHLVDLPGTYSLTANSPEEIIAREYIIRQKPDVVVAILSAPVLERNLYLVAELLHLDVPVVIGLNMVDVAAAEGIKIEPHVLEAAIGVPVVPLVATKAQGVRELMEAVHDVAHGRIPYKPKRPEIGADHRAVLEELVGLIGNDVPQDYPVQWVALKLLEGDSEVNRMMSERLPPAAWSRVSEILHAHEDAVLAVAGGRYEWVARMVRAAVVRPRAGQITFTSRLDQVATHPFWGLIVLAGILGAIFFLTYSIGTPLQDLLDRYLVQRIADWITTRFAAGPSWLVGLLVDGVLGGAGTVVTFAPILVIFFSVMGLMEDIGYMARAAYVMDRFMHLMGLHGKSFLPLFLGFGCNVSAVVGARVVESRPARLLTILLAPLVPCTGRMIVLTFLAPLFFAAPTLVSWGLIAVNLAVMAALGILLNKTLFRGEAVAFIMELPLYHRPNLRTIGLLIWHRTSEFLRKAGTLILLMSVGVWLLSALPTGDIQHSILARIGRGLEPVGSLMGLDWRMIVSLLTSFAAKENSLVTLGIVYGASAAEASLSEILQQSVSTAAALAFLVVQMLFVPCAATVAAMRQETHSWPWTLGGVALLLLVSVAGGVAAYQLALAVL